MDIVMDVEKIFDKLDEEKVMVMARGCLTMEELVERVGLAEEVIMQVEPKVDWWFRAVEAGTAVRKAHEVGDLRRMLMARKSLLRALWELHKEKEEVVTGVAGDDFVVEKLIKEVEGIENHDPMGEEEDEEMVI